MSVDSIPNEKLTGLPSINYIFECGNAGCIDGGYEHRGESGEDWRTGTGKAVNCPWDILFLFLPYFFAFLFASRFACFVGFCFHVCWQSYRHV